MFSNTPLRRLLVLSIVATLVLSACSSDDAGDTGGASTSSRSSVARSRSSSSQRSTSSTSAQQTSSAAAAGSSSSRGFGYFQRGSSSAGGVSASSVSAGGAPTTATTIRLFAESSPADAIPGGEVAFTISVRNTSSAALKNPQVVFSFSPAQLSVVEASGKIQPDHVQWTIENLAPNEKRTFVLQAKLAQSVQVGEIVRGNVIAIRDAVVEPNTVTVEVRVIDQLPVTGADGTRPVEDTTQFVRPYKGK